jgi:hypothetical protein
MVKKFIYGPLISPTVFNEVIGPHYKRITSLCNAHGIDIVSVEKNFGVRLTVIDRFTLLG